MVMCEECERKEADTDTIVDGESKKLCSQCARMTGAIVVEKPSQAKIDMSHYSRPKVRQVLSRMAGINSNNYTPESQRPEPVRNPYANLRIPASRKNISLDDLREVKRANEAENQQLNADVNSIEDVEAEVEQNKPRVSWFKKVAKIFKKEKKQEAVQEVQPGEMAEGPASGAEPGFNKVRVVDSRESQ